MNKYQFGVFLPFYAFQSKDPKENFQQLKTAVLESERLGYDAVWLDDHLMYGDWPLLECWTTLAALASCTSRIRLGSLVTCNSNRNPALLAKTAATIDVVSNGRLEFGIGAGCQEKEHVAYGYGFGNAKVRVEQLTEALEIMISLWTKEKTSFNGKHYTLVEALAEPKPQQKPHPPITIGGCGEKYTLKATAQYADRVDFGFLPTIEEYKRKLDVLERHCKVVGRPYGEIEKSCWPSGQILLAENEKEATQTMAKIKPPGQPLEEFRAGTFVGTPEKFATHLRRHTDLGATYFLLYFGDLPNVKSLKLFAEKGLKNFV